MVQYKSTVKGHAIVHVNLDDLIDALEESRQIRYETATFLRTFIEEGNEVTVLVTKKDA